MGYFTNEKYDLKAISLRMKLVVLFINIVKFLFHSSCRNMKETERNKNMSFQINVQRYADIVKDNFFLSEITECNIKQRYLQRKKMTLEKYIKNIRK